MENKFKKGDKVVPSKDFGKGYNYGLGPHEFERIKRFKCLTVSKCAIITTGYGEAYPAVWFEEYAYYWPTGWFKKLDSQMEFDFNG